MGELYESETNPFLELIDGTSEAHRRDELSALVAAVTEHPAAFVETMGKNLVAWDEWSKNSEQAAGQMLPGLLVGMVTDGASVGADGAGEAVEAAGAEAELAESATVQVARQSDIDAVKDVLRGLPKGRNPGVWTVGSSGDLRQLFVDMTTEGRPITWMNYAGPVSELPDGTQIGLRSFSRHGGETIDIRPPRGGDQWKIHIS